MVRGEDAPHSRAIFAESLTPNAKSVERQALSVQLFMDIQLTARSSPQRGKFSLCCFVLLF